MVTLIDRHGATSTSQRQRKRPFSPRSRFCSSSRKPTKCSTLIAVFTTTTPFLPSTSTTQILKVSMPASLSRKKWTPQLWWRVAHGMAFTLWCATWKKTPKLATRWSPLLWWALRWTTPIPSALSLSMEAHQKVQASKSPCPRISALALTLIHSISAPLVVWSKPMRMHSEAKSKTCTSRSSSTLRTPDACWMKSCPLQTRLTSSNYLLKTRPQMLQRTMVMKFSDERSKLLTYTKMIS